MRGRHWRRTAAATAIAATLVALPGGPAATAGTAQAPVTARVGEEVVLWVGANGAVRDASTVATRVTRERHGDVVVVTVP